MYQKLFRTHFRCSVFKHQPFGSGKTQEHNMHQMMSSASSLSSSFWPLVNRVCLLQQNHFMTIKFLSSRDDHRSQCQFPLFRNSFVDFVPVNYRPRTMFLTRTSSLFLAIVLFEQIDQNSILPLMESSFSDSTMLHQGKCAPFAQRGRNDCV